MSSEKALDFDMVDYARLHGLAVDHLAVPLPISHVETIQKSAYHNVIDKEGLLHIEFPIHVNIEEHLTVDEGAARLLQDANNGFSKVEIDSIVIPLLDTRLTKNLRMETPLLMTDHATDFKDFAQWEESHYIDGCLPMEPLDDEMDVGLGWPEKLQKLPAAILKELKREKIELSKEVLIYLRAEVKGSWTEENNREVWENATPHKRNTALEPVTPPLLPKSPPVTPYMHPSPDGNLPLLSDPASLINEDTRKAEESIFGGDNLIAPTAYKNPLSNFTASDGSDLYIDPFDIYLPTTSIGGIEHAFLPPRVKIRDCKVETPLTPPRLLAALPKTVKFSEVVGEMLLDPISNGYEDRASSASSEAAMDKFFQEAFGEAADRVNRTIGQEQLQEADANGRVAVPIMDFSLPEPPWKGLEKLSRSSDLVAAQKSYVKEIQEEFGHPVLWPGINKLVPKLRWTVFSSKLAKVVLDESFGDADTLFPFLHSHGDSVVDSSGLIWKPPGMRILNGNEADSEDELELGSFDAKQPQDVLSLIKKRKMKLLEEGSTFKGVEDSRKRVVMADGFTSSTTTHSQITEDVIPDKTSIHRGLSESQKDVLPASNKIENRSRKEMILDGPFCAADALNNFLEIRAAKTRKPINSAYFPGKPVAQGDLTTLPLKSSEPAKTADQLRAINRALPVPMVVLPSTPTPYVVSSTILKRRNFIRTLNSLFPSAIPIERDFTAHNITAWNPNSVIRSPVASALDSEADLIISPSTGIILTTLQKIKQKPLPGQKSKPAFKVRLNKVSLRYERLLVLVSEGCPDESTNCLAELDTLALAELIGFCGSLDVSTTVQFVAGGEETLAKWVFAAMAQYSLQGEAVIPLLQDETLWELFLRRAGMNAFAAQAVISQMKAPEGVEVNSPSKAGMFGITALVEMGPQERMTRFEGLLGGSRVLNRVGRLLDGNWP